MTKKVKPGAPLEDQNGAIPTTSHEYIASEDVTNEKPEGEDVTDVTIVELTIEERKKNEIARYHLADKAIAAMKKKYGKLAIAGIEDKDGYKKVHAAWQIVKNARIGIEKKHKEIKADYLAITKAIDGEKNRLTDLISPLETQLGDELDRIDNLKKAEAEREEREKQEKLHLRVSELLENGVSFNGSYYAIGASITVDIVSLGSYTDENFNELLARVKVEHQLIKDAEADRQRKADEDLKALELQKEEQRKKEAEQEAERVRLQAEKDELEKEREAMRKEKRDARTGQLEAIGLQYSYKGQAWGFNSTCGSYVYKPTDDIAGIEAEAWTAILNDAREVITRLKEEQRIADAAKVERERLRKERADLLLPFSGYGPTFDAGHLEDLAKADFEKLLNDVADAKKKADEFSKRRDEIELRYKLREQQLTDLFGMTVAGSVFYRKPAFENTPAMSIDIKHFRVSDAEWATLIESQKVELKNVLEAEKEAQRLIDEKLEADRKAALSEAENVLEWLRKIDALPVPTPSNPRLSNLVSAVENAVNVAIKELE